jgi:hypothetical protein
LREIIHSVVCAIRSFSSRDHLGDKLLRRLLRIIFRNGGLLRRLGRVRLLFMDRRRRL